MTRQSGLDLTGANIYNENGGIAQGQICGQALITKLLKTKKSLHGAMQLSHEPLLLHDDGSSRCSPVATLKKTKVHKSYLYENINVSNDTESCSSDEVFAEAISSGSSSSLGRALEDLQTPTFVAQFDPMQLFNPQVHEHQTSSGPRKPGAAWSASLPAVLEEDSRDSESEQDSNNHGQGGIWRNLQNMLTKSVPIDEDDADSMPGQQEQVLLESDRIASPPSIPHSHAPNFQLDHQERVDSDEQETDPTFMNMFKRRDDKTKRSKESLMRDAVDRRIQQVMKEDLGERDEPPSEKDALEDEEYHVFDMNRGATDVPDETPLVEHSTSSPFHKGPSKANSSLHAAHAHGFHPETLNPSHVASQMQDLLKQQQATLKEMSLQNYHYRKELSECQDMFGQWRLEREKQQSTINDLIKEKEAYASDANFLRDQMFSIRLELETLRKETQLQAEFQKQRHSPVKDSSPRRQETRSRILDQQHRFYHHYEQQSPLKRECSSQGLSSNPVPTPPPPPPKQRPQQTPPRLDPKGANQQDKAFLVSKLKASGTQTDPAKKHGRSVKFQDPPKSREWALFPNHLHDDRMMNSPIEVRNRSNWAADNGRPNFSQPEAIAKRGATMVVQVHPNDGVDVHEEEPTPIAANGRAAMAAGDDYEATKSVYKYRLETIQRRRQQRVGRDDSGRNITGGDGGDAGTPEKQRKRRSRPAVVQ